jgi:hypothetical protein
VRHRILIIVGLLSAVVMCSFGQAQQKPVEDPTAEIIDLRKRILRTNEENLELMRSLSYNQVTRLSGSICLNDINNTQEHVAGKLETVIAFARARSQSPNAQEESIPASYLKSYIGLVMEDLPLDRKKINLSAGICGAVPVIVNRAQVALAFLNEVERTLSRLNQRY